METWFVSRVLLLLLMLAVVAALPGPLGARSPGNNATDSVTAGFYDSAATDERSRVENNATSTAYSSESSSPSQSNILLTHTAETRTAEAHTAETHTAAAGNVEQTQTFAETSESLEAVSLSSTEPLSSTLVGATTEASGSTHLRESANTERAPDASAAVSWRASPGALTEESRPPRDGPDTAVRPGDASPSAPRTAVHTDSAYTSATVSRAGERTLLSVTYSSGNSTSFSSSSSSFSSSSSSSGAFTEDSSSHQPRSTWGVSDEAAETEDYTRSGPSTGTDSGDATDRHVTLSVGGMFSETAGSAGATGSLRANRQPNATQHHRVSTPEETSGSTPPLTVTEPGTERPEASASPAPSVTSPAEGPADAPGTDRGLLSGVPTSTESSTGAHSSIAQQPRGTEGVSSRTQEQSEDLGLTTAPPTVGRSTPELDGSWTHTSVLVTEAFLTTTPVIVTERSQITEEDTFTATAANTTPSLPATSWSTFSSTARSSTAGSPTDATLPYTTPSVTPSTRAPQTSAAHPTHHTWSGRTHEPSAATATPTNVSTQQVETSTGTPGATTDRSLRGSTTHARSAPTESTGALQTTGGQTDRGTTEPVATTAPTKAPPTPTPPRNPCVLNPCMNGGMCLNYKGHQFSCHCQQAWTGPTCNDDVNECEGDPCPAGSTCVNTRGSFSCECPLGFDLENGRTCTKAKTFLGTFSVNRPQHDPVVFNSAAVHEIHREIIQLLNASLSVLRGYSRSTLKHEDGLRILAVNMFSISSDVTSAEVLNSIQMSLSNCSSSLAHCRMVLHHQLTYHGESLCVAQKAQCDTERSACADSSGAALCRCLQGYYKHNPDDLSCLECGDGYKLENDTCVPCTFGFGGFNCGNFYKLIAVVVSPAGGALLLILVIALIVTCCKKDKNDINKIIFKSGDLQMSPYADFPKSNRISMEWGRETIEMQENGSTKNLLQMTDIYYSPALRNSDLERNGLYPFTGLPGSRHSCIYPAQWNPSFISDDSRRRDYF